eukprot:scaffold78382_cov63-Phaeocystis_antarctica.AAC.2
MLGEARLARLLPVVLGLLQRARLLGLVGHERLGLEEPDEEVIARRRRPRRRHSPLRNRTAYRDCLLNGDLLRDGSPLGDDLLDDSLDHLLDHLLGRGLLRSDLLHCLLRLGFRTAAAAEHGRCLSNTEHRQRAARRGLADTLSSCRHAGHEGCRGRQHKQEHRHSHRSRRANERRQLTTPQGHLGGNKNGKGTRRTLLSSPGP